MAKLNTSTAGTGLPTLTHEGAPAHRAGAADQLRRSLMACLLWEDTFYENGQEIGSRLADVTAKVDPAEAASQAVEARTRMKIRHAPLLVARAMAAASPAHKAQVADLLATIIQRPDELTEFLAIYWKDKRQPLSAQVKKGLARAFQKFDAYQLAKYDRQEKVTLKDVLFLSHAKPKDPAQAELWKQLIDGTMPTPDTWEVQLSAGEDKKATWERLITEEKLGALAMIRNIRNMTKADVSPDVIKAGLAKMRVDRVLPFRFITAARYNPAYEPELEAAMFKAIEGQTKLPGRTVLLVDNSGSMDAKLSDKSDTSRADAACGLAVLVREVCEEAVIISFGQQAVLVPPRRGFALRDAIQQANTGKSTYTETAKKLADGYGYDRLIIITDEQSHQALSDPKTDKAYVINVASYKNGIGYGKWTHIDGWSEAAIDYIRAAEAASQR